MEALSSDIIYSILRFFSVKEIILFWNLVSRRLHREGWKQLGQRYMKYTGGMRRLERWIAFLRGDDLTSLSITIDTASDALVKVPRLISLKLVIALGFGHMNDVFSNIATLTKLTALRIAFPVSVISNDVPMTLEHFSLNAISTLRSLQILELSFKHCANEVDFSKISCLVSLSDLSISASFNRCLSSPALPAITFLRLIHKFPLESLGELLLSRSHLQSLDLSTSYYLPTLPWLNLYSLRELKLSPSVRRIETDRMPFLEVFHGSPQALSPDIVPYSNLKHLRLSEFDAALLAEASNLQTLELGHDLLFNRRFGPVPMQCTALECSEADIFHNYAGKGIGHLSRLRKLDLTLSYEHELLLLPHQLEHLVLCHSKENVLSELLPQVKQLTFLQAQFVCSDADMKEIAKHTCLRVLRLLELWNVLFTSPDLSLLSPLINLEVLALPAYMFGRPGSELLELEGAQLFDWKQRTIARRKRKKRGN